MQKRSYLISSLPVELGREDQAIPELLAEVLGGSPKDFTECTLERQSIDARHKARIRFLLSLRFSTCRELITVGLPPGTSLAEAPTPFDFTPCHPTKKPKVVITGSGPAGSFCALRLLDYGVEPILLERGPAMEERIQAVERLWKTGELELDANAQFGEGGAGTFSDGKLATRIDHKNIRYVLESFVRFGANPAILYQAKPHVGTDVIRRCCVRLRQEAESRGATYRFRSRLADIRFHEGKVCAAVLDNGEEIPCDALVLAMGHSARDTFEMLHRHGIAIRQKAFAMGVRIEHPQALVDKAQYGPSKGHKSLGPADYKLVCNLGTDRAAYSFCMCPGGEVIQCASEEGGVVVNGMSKAARNSGFANSGLVAKVNPADFQSEHLLAGMYFQRRWEQICFKAAGDSYGAPAMPVVDFLKGRSSSALPRSTFTPFLVPCDLKRCLPEFITEQLLQAFPVFEKKIHGYTSREALLIGIESRTSSPIQILRGADCQSLTHPGLYPCGEGAGYAGGITSAAVDGIRIAELLAGDANFT